MTSQTSLSPLSISSEAAQYESAFSFRDADFYRNYGRCLNIYPSLAELLRRLSGELGKCAGEAPKWHQQEILTNIFLYCSAIADTTDDYLFGPAYDLSKVALVPFSGLAIRVFNRIVDTKREIRSTLLKGVHKWRRAWSDAVQEFLRTSLVADGLPSAGLVHRLQALTEKKLPSDLLNAVAKIPAAFRSQDMSHYDVLALAEQFLASIEDQRRPILIVGLRTAGSYFAPLVTAYLQANGCADVDSVTLRPKRGIASWERAKLARYAAKQGRVAIIDEPIGTGKTLLKTLDLLQRSGFRDRLSILIPVHASGRDWQNSEEIAQTLPQHHIVVLEPEQWYKWSVLSEESVGNLMREWLANDDISNVSVSSDAASETANRKLDALSEHKFHSRVKRVYRVDLRDSLGRKSTRYVLAKGVGWGWYGYHAVFSAEKLQGFVPRMIGFRHGLLFEEWVGQQHASAERDRAQFIERGAAYIAARARQLKLDTDPVRALAADNRHRATDELAGAFGNAYGSKPAGVLRRSLLRGWLTAEACPLPTLIDGKMRPQEWVKADDRLVKSDFEHHGLGKTELNVVDPAYDLADAVLQWHLSAEEEKRLIADYVARSGDRQVADRLHLNKVLAGLYNMLRAVDNLNDARLAHEHERFSRAYIDAWTFLIVQTTRFAGSLCGPKVQPKWHSPLVVIDLDGVLDKQIFGYPSTTAAGIRAVSLFHAHHYALAVNSARSVAEVKEYCRAYQMAGGVSEYGAYVWDAISDKEQILVSPESLRQIEILAGELQRIPGIFLNEDYKYSIRAFTYQKGVTVAVPKLLIQNLISTRKLDRLTSFQTFLDTTVVAKETDKGRGLLALLSLAGRSPKGVIAIGDSEPDLPMFRVVERSYAPSHIPCKQAARLLGCRIVNGTYQAGLLDAALKIVHQGRRRCGKCAESERLLNDTKDLFVHLLGVADGAMVPALLKAILSRKALASLRQ